MIYYELFYEYMPDMLAKLYFRFGANLLPDPNPSHQLWVETRLPHHPHKAQSLYFSEHH